MGLEGRQHHDLIAPWKNLANTIPDPQHDVDSNATGPTPSDEDKLTSQETAPGIKSNDAVPGPPNGGTKAWLQVLGSWFLVFNTMGTIVTFGLYQAYYERGIIFTESSANISWIGSIQSFIFFALGVLTGPVYDRGRLRLLLVVGSFCIVFGHMMLSLCEEYWQIVLAQGFVVGAGGGCLFVPALAVVQPYFSTRLGMALGIIGTGSSIGCVIYAVVFINLIDRVGFAWTVRTLGFLSLGTLCIPIIVMHMRGKPPAARRLLDISAFTDRTFILSILGCFLGYGGCQVSFFYIAYYGEVKGWLAGNLALYLLPIVNAGSILGRVIPNVLADKIGPVNVIIPGSVLIAAVLLCNLAVVNAAGIVCVAVFFGMLSGTFISLPPLLFMAYTKDKTKLGARMGMAYAIIGLSVLPGGPGAGGVLQHDGDSLDWTAAWTYAAALLLSACLVFCVLRFSLAGFKVRAKV